MRLNDLNDGSIKTLLILGLLFANIAVALPRHGGRVRNRGEELPSRLSPADICNGQNRCGTGACRFSPALATNNHVTGNSARLPTY